MARLRARQARRRWMRPRPCGENERAERLVVFRRVVGARARTHTPRPEQRAGNRQPDAAPHAAAGHATVIDRPADLARLCISRSISQEGRGSVLRSAAHAGFVTWKAPGASCGPRPCCVVSRVCEPMPRSAKCALDKPIFLNFCILRREIRNGNHETSISDLASHSNALSIGADNPAKIRLYSGIETQTVFVSAVIR